MGLACRNAPVGHKVRLPACIHARDAAVRGPRRGQHDVARGEDEQVHQRLPHALGVVAALEVAVHLERVGHLLAANLARRVAVRGDEHARVLSPAAGEQLRSALAVKVPLLGADLGPADWVVVVADLEAKLARPPLPVGEPGLSSEVQKQRVHHVPHLRAWAKHHSRHCSEDVAVGEPPPGLGPVQRVVRHERHEIIVSRHGQRGARAVWPQVAAEELLRVLRVDGAARRHLVVARGLPSKAGRLKEVGQGRVISLPEADDERPVAHHGQQQARGHEPNAVAHLRTRLAAQRGTLAPAGASQASAVQAGVVSERGDELGIQCSWGGQTHRMGRRGLERVAGPVLPFRLRLGQPW
mmetsp:Transcript_283/g.899  ORF Transcript_283/g.899 Transcript_283/m.899 type:complete len:354 (-) Transcript_283:331-1392(-)